MDKILGDGNPASPVPGLNDDPSFNGMSLRDYAAVRFMATFLTGAVLPPGFDAGEQIAFTAGRAYECADALLRARAA
jgi:hypothetical protein